MSDANQPSVVSGLEVAFVRWVPAYERVLAYFANFVLIAAFLGLGLRAILPGSVVGGLIEYSALIIGFRHQLVITFVIYALSYLPLIGQFKRRVPTAV